jgi:hypothetical protein
MRLLPDDLQWGAVLSLHHRLLSPSCSHCPLPPCPPAPLPPGVKLPMHEVLQQVGAFEASPAPARPAELQQEPQQEPQLAAALSATDAASLRRSRKALLSEHVGGVQSMPDMSRCL